MARIPLPPVIARAGATAHPYPVQISFQTLEFLQGAIFHYTLMDTAAAELALQPGGIGKVEATIIAHGIKPDVVEISWAILKKYHNIFENAATQSTIIAFCSHWDWYVRHLARFIIFALDQNHTTRLRGADLSDLQRIDRLTIVSQIKAIERTTGVAIAIDDDLLDHLSEMGFVRNIGIHNRWEIDDHYLSRTKIAAGKPGDIRVVAHSELHAWHGALISLIGVSWQEVAKRFVSAPAFGNV